MPHLEVTQNDKSGLHGPAWTKSDKTTTGEKAVKLPTDDRDEHRPQRRSQLA